MVLSGMPDILENLLALMPRSLKTLFNSLASSSSDFKEAIKRFKHLGLSSCNEGLTMSSHLGSLLEPVLGPSF